MTKTMTMNKTTALLIGYFIVLPIIALFTLAYLLVMFCVSLIYLLEVIFSKKKPNAGEYAQNFTYAYFTTIKDVFKDDDNTENQD
jgi:hypothetical protein